MKGRGLVLCYSPWTTQHYITFQKHANSNTVDSRYLELAYLEAIIWSLLTHENLTTGNKISWKRREIAPKEQFILFSTIFSTYL